GRRSPRAGTSGPSTLDLARELLGFPSDRDWAFLISLGYPADRPLIPVRNPRRRPFGEVVHRGRWLSVSQLGELGADGGGVGVGGTQDTGAVGDHLAVELLGFRAAALPGGQLSQDGAGGEGV